MTTDSPQPVGPTRSDAAGGSFFERSYRAFISYSHTDAAWANWLIRRLEGYRVPERFQGRAAPIGEVGARIAPVFRDRDELPTADDLGDAVQDALRRSATLIVICSPAAARSRWVNEEAMVFKRLGRGDRVFALIVGGEPGAQDPAQECFPPALRFSVGSAGALSDNPVELIAADAREHADGKEDAFIRLVAGLLGVGFDDLRQREMQRRHRRMMWIAAGATAGMAITLGLATVAWLMRGDAKRRQQRGETLMTLMLDDLNKRLKQSDRLDTLDEMAEQAMAYFKTLDPRDQTDSMLAKHAKALTQLSEIRSKQLKNAEAREAVAAAYERLAVLTQRHPQDGEMLFDRAQAEFLIGNMHYRSGALGPASEWLARYRDTGVALAGLDPSNTKYQREADSGRLNLAVLELDRGNLAAAGSDFARELAVREKVAAAHPEDRDLEYNVTSAVSYLGTVAERSGDFKGALARFGEQTRRLEALAKKDPLTPRWQERVANALAMEATICEISGEPAMAFERRAQARAMLEAQVAKNPTNRLWQLAWVKLSVKEAGGLQAKGDAAAAQRLVTEALAGLERLKKAEPSDRGVAIQLVAAWRLEAELRAAARRPDAAAAVAQAVTIGEELLAKEWPNDDVMSEHLRACVTAGRIARQHGEGEAAQRAWRRAVEAVQPRLQNSSNWRLLDPAARALAFLGRGNESSELIERLRKFGYQPLEPWPEPTISSSNNNPKK